MCSAAPAGHLARAGGYTAVTRQLHFCTIWSGISLAPGLLVGAASHTLVRGPSALTAAAARRSNGTSPRSSVYYGISQANEGPAVRDAIGYKLILGADGGGKGAWSAQQLPNASSSCRLNASYDALSLLQGSSRAPTSVEAWGDGDSAALYHLPSDPGEHVPLDLTAHAAAVERLRALAKGYESTKVPQVTGDPDCPSFAPLDSPQGKWIGPWCDAVS